MSDQHKTTQREALARFLMGGSRDFQDEGQPYEELSGGMRARREQPKWGAPVWPEIPLWDWHKGGEAERILRFLGIDPEAPAT
jgi:hypothetical protein